MKNGVTEGGLYTGLWNIATQYRYIHEIANILELIYLTLHICITIASFMFGNT